MSREKARGSHDPETTVLHRGRGPADDLRIVAGQKGAFMSVFLWISQWELWMYGGGFYLVIVIFAIGSYLDSRKP